MKYQVFLKKREVLPSGRMQARKAEHFSFQLLQLPPMLC